MGSPEVLTFPVEEGILPESPPFVLVVEDNPADIRLLREAVRRHDLDVRMLVADDGEKAIHWIDDASLAITADVPQVIVLDLNLPRRTGTEVLEHLREVERFRNVPVIIFTSSNSSRDRSLASRYRSTWFLSKAADLDEFFQVGRLIKDVLSGTTRPC